MPGDATLEQWKALRERQGGPLECDVLVAPHHGGNIGAADEGLRWVYSEAVKSDVTIVSVGTSNTYKHPLPIVVSEITSAGSQVMCTQITKQCCQQLETVRPGVQSVLHPVRRSSASGDFTGAGNSRNVACAGTIVADVSDAEVSIRNLDQHKRGVDRLVERGGIVPLCRR